MPNAVRRNPRSPDPRLAVHMLLGSNGRGAGPWRYLLQATNASGSLAPLASGYPMIATGSDPDAILFTQEGPIFLPASITIYTVAVDHVPPYAEPGKRSWTVAINVAVGHNYQGTATYDNPDVTTTVPTMGITSLSPGPPLLEGNFTLTPLPWRDIDP